MISIVVPVYNGAKTIKHCLSSIFASKIDASFEVIVVDDGSTDSTGKIAKGFPCKYFRIEKKGAAAARNFGIRQASGEIIFFFDADGRIKKDTIKKFLKHFQEDKDADIIQGMWDKDGECVSFSSRLLLLKYFYGRVKLLKNVERVETANLETGCLAMRAEIFKHFNGFDEGYKLAGGEEHEFGMRLLGKYKIFYYADLFIEHRFENIFKVFKKIYRRTVNFSLLLFKIKNKENLLRLHKSSVPTHDKIGVIVLFLMFCAIPLLFFDMRIGMAIIFVLFVAYLVSIFGFLNYMVTEEGFYFALKGAFANLFILLPRLFGFLTAALIFYILRDREFKI